MFASPGGYYPGFAVEVEPEVLAARVAAVVRGRPWLKLVGDWPRKGEDVRPNFDEAALHAAVGVAHAAGCKVAIHTMAPDVPGMAVRAGVDSIEHGLFLSEADLAGLGSRGGTWVPTVRRTRQLLEAMSPGSSGARILGEGLVNTSRMLGAAAELGVVVLAGSDLAMASSRIGEEVLGLMELGCAAEPAVASALASTIDGTGEHASAGAPADLVAFENHPWEDPSTMLDPVFVMRMGRVLFDRRS
jgi:imidazolonepropionase-like amidohydrolase